MNPTDLFRFSIDRGGTFTDIYAEVPGKPGHRVVKLLSEDPDHYADAPREGIRRILEDVLKQPLPKEKFDTRRVQWVRMGTTVATNALLERKGARFALVISKGFRDLLNIGKQNRPHIFDLQIQKPGVLYETVFEVEERVRLVRGNDVAAGKNVVKGLDGETLEVLNTPDLDRLKKQLLQLRMKGIDGLTVVLMHSYTFPDHEQQIGNLAAELGFSHVALSSQVMPRIKIVDRGQTCCVDAYLTPGIQEYLNGFRSGFVSREMDLLFMQSDGGLVDADHFSGSRAILSGPAGGVVGYAMTTFDPVKKQPVIGFDMGGTSTDVSRFGGEYEWVHEMEIAGVHLQSPQLFIKTVAAGGGSRLFFKNGMFAVGPESSGAHPGPVCYRKNGFLSVTDANLVLGRLLPDFFPKIFGPQGDQPLDAEASCGVLRVVAEEINSHHHLKGKKPMSLEEVAHGFIRVANEVMARAIREISVTRGYDIQEHVLACFGGAGGQHACALAKSLGISKIFIHRFAGILSAYGLGLADVVDDRQEPASGILDESSLAPLSARLDRLGEQSARSLRERGFTEDLIAVYRFMNLRYQGTDTSVMIPQPPDGDYAREFRERYRREMGFDLVGRDIQVDDLRVRAVAKGPGLNMIPLPRETKKAKPVSVTPCYFEGGWLDSPVFLMDHLRPGHSISGPAILISNTSTLLIEPDCSARITGFGDVEIDVPAPAKKIIGTQADPVQLSIFSHLFMSIAEQMGWALQRMAVSTNIKERLDFSCALFDREGNLVANAPHQPVHLGSMGEAVRRQIEIYKDDLHEGDVWVTNHPIAGGSHLPDITVITPVLKDGEPIFFVASRGHHPDIGGISPGSMPPFSKSLDEEGVCIKSFKLVDRGVFQEEGIRYLFKKITLNDGKDGVKTIHCSRAPEDNISDLKAQIAANKRGMDLLLDMVDHYSLEAVQAYMKHIQMSAEEAVRDMLRELSHQRGLKEIDSVEAEDFMDDGTPIRLRLTIDRKKGSAVFDFTGTGPQVPGNCNSPRAVTHSAILYSLRCLVQSDIPLNQGCLNPIQVIIEDGSILSPSEDAAVVGGNVLTSQRITDVILKAFGAAAASQGCMNNFTFGDERFGYYETIGGGAGAGPSWHGCSGVHTHMTNTRITDPEILEKRYPVLLREFSIREGSGGKGTFNGGDGLIREFEFLRPLNAAILSERRVYAPYGLEGGQPGEKGRNLLIRKDGTIIDLEGKSEIHAEPGDRIRILTPGGGGYGKPENKP